MIRKRDAVIGLILAAGVLAVAALALAVLAVASLDEPLIGEPSVAVVDIAGGIYTPAGTVEQIDRYARHDNVPAIVIRLNTPGGGVAATQEIFEAVRRARDEGKIVIASMGTIAASGGYYIAAACDTIMANPATVTGSIGVIATYPNLSGLYEKIGIGYTIIKAGEFKDTGTTTREPTEAERAYLDEVVGDMFEQFIEAVARERDMAVDEVRVLADGRIFTGRQAHENGLVDVLGTFRDAVDLAGGMAGLGDDPPVYREAPDDVWGILLEGAHSIAARFPERPLPTMSYLMAW